MDLQYSQILFESSKLLIVIEIVAPKIFLNHVEIELKISP